MITTLFALLVVILLVTIITTIACIRMVIRSNGIIRKIYEYVKKKFIWGVFIRYVLEEYLMVSIANTIKLYDLHSGSFWDVVSSTIAIMTVIILIALPFTTRIFLYIK